MSGVRRDSVGSSSNKLQIPKVKGRTKSVSTTAREANPTIPARLPLSDLSNRCTSTISHKGFLESLLTSAVRNCHPDAKPFIKDYKSNKEQLIKVLFTFYNKVVFGNILPADMKVTWNARLTKTAGNCYYEVVEGSGEHRCYIHLSVKVLDTCERLCRTLVHEMCHAASWIVDKQADGHGPLWRAWTEKAMDTLPELPEITMYHSYDIRCRYTYRCRKCNVEIGRHSKSIDTGSKVCGSIRADGQCCRGNLELIVNHGFTPVKLPKKSAKKTEADVDDLVKQFTRTRI